MKLESLGKRSLLGIAAALMALLVLTSSIGLSATGLARAALAVTGLACLVGWLVRARGARATFEPAPRMTVVASAGLSPRTGLTLVEVDGQTFLVVHGDGFAQVCSPGGIRPTPKLHRERATDSFPKFDPRCAPGLR